MSRLPSATSTQAPARPRSSALAAMALAVALSGVMTALAPAAGATAGEPQARNDRATVKAGTAKKVNVVANDRIASKGRVKVLVVRVAGPGRARVAGKKIVVRIPAKAKAGTYRIRYRLIDAAGRKDAAVLRVTVPARSIRSQKPPSLPSVMEPPGAPVVTDITCIADGDATWVTYHWQVSGGRYTHYNPNTGELTRITDGQTVTGRATAFLRMPIEDVRKNPLHVIINNSYQQFIAPLNWAGRYPSETTLLKGNPQPKDVEALVAITNC